VALGVVLGVALGRRRSGHLAQFFPDCQDSLRN